MPKNFYLQCKHTHDNDLIFHIFADRFMPDLCGAEPEHNMHESLVLFIKTNYEEVNKITRSFLRWKSLTLDNYLEYIEKPGNRGDELSVDLLAMMQVIHYCIITKNNIYYSMPNAMPNPSAVHMTLVYLGNKVFRDTTVSKKGPPKIQFKQEMPTSSHTQPPPTPREEWKRKRDKRKAAEALDAQESTDSETDVYAQESHEESEKEKEDKSPLPIQKNVRKGLGVVKSKEYKIWRPKNREVIRKCSLCSEKFSSQKELNDHIAAHHNYKFLCSDRKCDKAFGSLESLKKHQLHHRDMKFLCSVCEAKFPFASYLSSYQALHLQGKKIVCPYPKYSRKYKTKLELNHHYNYRHKQKSSKVTIEKCSVCNKTFQRTKYLKEHMKVHVEDLPFKCSIHGERFKWRSGHKIHMQAKHTEESLSHKF